MNDLADLISPSGATFEWNRTFTWKAAAGAAWYQLEVQTENGDAVMSGWYSGADHDWLGKDTCTLAPWELPVVALGNYKWRVRDDITGIVSPFRAFTLMPVPVDATTGIHDLVLLHVQAALQKSMIDDLPKGDATRAGVISIGPVQGDPTPDDARITITIHENDPDAMLGGSVSGLKGDWPDVVEDIEIGGTVTYKRRFSVKARCLLVNSGENLANARTIASTVRERIEKTLLNLSFSGVYNPDEFVSGSLLTDEFAGEMLQAGGPDAYDYQIKVRFSLLTTRNGVTQ